MTAPLKLNVCACPKRGCKSQRFTRMHGNTTIVQTAKKNLGSDRLAVYSCEQCSEFLVVK